MGVHRANELIDAHPNLFVSALAFVLMSMVRSAQPAGVPGYLLALDPTDADTTVLVMPMGRYAVAFGTGCEAVPPPVNVTVLAGSGGVATLETPDGSTQCNVLIGERVSAQPCLTNDAGVCDVAVEFDS